MKRRLGKTLLGASALVIVSCLASCQAVFTWSPLSFLQRDPSTMTTEQKLTYADEALASGDPAALASAYDTIAVEAAAHPDDPDIQYTAAQLALQISGVGTVLDSFLTSLGDPSAAPLTITADTFASIDRGTLADAGAYLVDAEAAGANLTATDYLVGAVALVVADSSSSDVLGTIDPLSPNVVQAEAFLAAGIAELPADDPAVAILQSLLDSFQAGGVP